MADVLRIKRRAVGGAAGPPASLAAAEIAFNEVDNTLYYGKGNSAGMATSIIPIAGSGATVPIATSDTPPVAPVDGTAWYDTVGTNLYLYVDDGTSSQWVPATNPPGVPPGAAGGDLGSTYPNPTVVATHLAAPLPIAQGGTGVTTGAFNVTSINVNARNVTPGQIQAVQGFPGTVPAHGGSGMQGLAFPFTPTSTGRVHYVITGSIAFDATTTVSAQVMFGTGTAPVRGAASTGTPGIYMQVTATLNQQIPCPLPGIVTGLTIGTAYWFDVLLNWSASTGCYFSANYSFLEI